MRMRARVDANQKDIVNALRALGALVQMTHTLGKGVPDLIVGYRGRLTMLEIKDGAKPKSARKLTDDEKRFMLRWSEYAKVVSSIDEAYEAIGAYDTRSTHGLHNAR